MKKVVVSFLFVSILLISLSTILNPLKATAQEQKPLIPNKALCAKMLRFGKEAYARGKYLDAKEYFRKAVQADPFSQVAWRYYDQAVIFALAEKVEKEANLLLPDVSTRTHLPTQGPPAPSPASPKKPATGAEEDEEEEGC